MLNRIFRNFLSYFPENKSKWLLYLKTSLPVVLAAMIFALNAFVDNFMSTNIEGGNQALSYANTWTEIEIGIISLTTIVGSSLFAQYLGKYDVAKMKEVINVRLLFGLLIAFIFAIPAMATPDNMVKLISGFDNNMLSVVLDNATIYLRLITVSWILNAIWFIASMILREKHHGISSFISSLISLVLNIVLNSIFTYGLHLGIKFLAISTIIANVCSLAFVIIFVIVKDKDIFINPLKIFKISKYVWTHFFRRYISFLLLTVGSVAVNIRFVFWNIGYPTGSVGQQDFVLSAASILGISGMFFNIFWTTFESINANISIYVGKNLGSNNFEDAKRNAKELQGFHTTFALIMGLILFCFSFVVEKMNFLAEGYKQSLINHLEGLNKTQEEINSIVNLGVKTFLENLKFTLWPLAFFMPLFIWFITRSRVIAAGGLTNITAAVEAIAGIIQIGWLCAIAFGFKKFNLAFPWAYFIFFLSDIPKFIVYEIIYYKVNWVRNITSEE